MAAGIEGTTFMAGTRTSAARERVSASLLRGALRRAQSPSGRCVKVILENTLGKRLTCCAALRASCGSSHLGHRWGIGPTEGQPGAARTAPGEHAKRASPSKALHRRERVGCVVRDSKLESKTDFINTEKLEKRGRWHSGSHIRSTAPAMGEKSLVFAYVLWLLAGWTGIHHFYLGRDPQVQAARALFCGAH